MANLPLAFGELLGGGVLAVAGITGYSVADVIDGRAKTIKPLEGAGSGASSSSTGASAPLTATPGTGGLLASLWRAGSKLVVGRHDQGLDVEGPPNSPIIAPGSGYLIRNGSDPSGFGASYPIVHFTSGPWAGLDVYFGHIRSMLSGAFSAGQVIGLTQDGSGPYVGNAAGMPGHIEIGLAPGGSPGPWGQPLPTGL